MSETIPTLQVPIDDGNGNSVAYHDTNGTSPVPPSSVALETEVLAREAGRAFGQLVSYYREHYKLSPEEARNRAYELTESENAEAILNRPAEEVDWLDLDRLARHDPALAEQRWEDAKEAALDELQSGHRAAKVMEAGVSGCWRRAEFLALRHELAYDWQPRNGIERQLIDTMAQAQTGFLYWLKLLNERTLLPELHQKELETKGKWLPPSITDSEAIEQAAEMMDRFNRIYLRTLRALHELRRHPPKVIVKKAGQVNIGRKQVNVASR
jgi:hypothetical protein